MCPRVVERWLDALDAQGRYALIKLITGSLRIGVSARLAKTALAEWGKCPVDEIEEVWHGLTPPYLPLFEWLEGKAERPAVGRGGGFPPADAGVSAGGRGHRGARCLASTGRNGSGTASGCSLSRRGGECRIYSRTGDDIGPAFPEMLEAMDFDAVLDGELLVTRDGVVAPFNDLQQRLNRKAVTAKMLLDYPAYVRLYDILFEGPEDLRQLGFEERRRRLEDWYARAKPQRMDLSPMLPFETWGELGGTAQRRP